MGVKAYILIVAQPGKTRDVVAAIRGIPQVVESHEVMGPYDIIVEVEAQALPDIPPILGDKIRTIDGVESTTSLVTFPE